MRSADDPPFSEELVSYKVELIVPRKYVAEPDPSSYDVKEIGV